MPNQISCFCWDGNGDIEREFSVSNLFCENTQVDSKNSYADALLGTTKAARAK